MPLPEAMMRLGDLVTRRPWDVAIEDCDVVDIDAQHLQSDIAVTGDVGSRSPPDGGHREWPLPYRARPRRSAHAPFKEWYVPGHIVGISRTPYPLDNSALA